MKTIKSSQLHLSFYIRKERKNHSGHPIYMKLSLAKERRRVWQLNPLPVFPLTSKLCFDPNLKVLKTLGFWNYT